jgi:hypothetical protein
VVFGWGSSTVSVMVTVIGPHGAVLTTYYSSLAVGDTATITMPQGAAAVTLSRHTRQRVRLGKHRQRQAPRYRY